MRVAIAGSSGLIGESLIRRLEERGDTVVRIVRPVTTMPGIGWDPEAGTVDRASLEGFDAVVNLAGRSIGERRWTAAEKQLLWSSRVDASALLSEALASLSSPPRTLVNASAVGFYGDGGDWVLDESAPAGAGFLARLSVAWEDATFAASAAGIRVARARSGIVLSSRGGALGRLLAPFGPKWLSPFRWGLGGPVGGGGQWWSWISLEDEVGALLHLLDAAAEGPFNLVSPTPVTNRQFTKALGRVLRRPAVLPIPGLFLKAILGSELAEALVLEGQRAVPAALLAGGFRFRRPDLEDAMRVALGE